LVPNQGGARMHERDAMEKKEEEGSNQLTIRIIIFAFIEFY
jgi:hypothetical protein